MIFSLRSEALTSRKGVCVGRGVEWDTHSFSLGF